MVAGISERNSIRPGPLIAWLLFRCSPERGPYEGKWSKWGDDGGPHNLDGI